MGGEPTLGLEGAQSRPCARAHASIDRARIVSVARERALGSGNAGSVRSVGLRGASQSGGVRHQGQDLSGHHFLVAGNSRSYDGGLRQERGVDDLADLAAQVFAQVPR